jgi:glutamate 5-kinase
VSVIVAKVGSSTLVDADGRLREDILAARVRDLVRLRRLGYRPVLVTSGAIACGLGRLGIRERPTALPDLQAASAVGQGVLFQRYLELFTAQDETPAQVLLTSEDLKRRGSYINARTTLTRLLDLGVIPVINENDTTATDELTFGDNDVLAAQVAILMSADSSASGRTVGPNSSATSRPRRARRTSCLPTCAARGSVVAGCPQRWPRPQWPPPPV